MVSQIDNFFKLYLKLENYLFETIDYNNTCKIFLNSHNLNIDTKWYKKNLEVTQRKCIHRDSHETEDELHFSNKCR